MNFKDITLVEAHKSSMQLWSRISLITNEMTRDAWLLFLVSRFVDWRISCRSFSSWGFSTLIFFEGMGTLGLGWRPKDSFCEGTWLVLWLLSPSWKTRLVLPSTNSSLLDPYPMSPRSCDLAILATLAFWSSHCLLEMEKVPCWGLVCKYHIPSQECQS